MRQLKCHLLLQVAVEQSVSMYLSLSDQ